MPALLLVLAAVAGFGQGAGRAEEAPVFPVEVTAHPIGRFKIGSDERRFEALEFVGGLELRSRTRQFGSISGFRRLNDDDAFLAVTDTGYWIFGQLDRHADGRPAGLVNLRMQAIADAQGNRHEEKSRVDAESLHVDGDIAIVGFEHDHRIAVYEIEADRMSAEKRRFDYLIPRHELRRNAGFEALARAPADSHLAGALIVITERSVDPEGNLFAAILEGPGKGVFKVVRKDGFAVTDSVFLPDGDLLLVERSFNIMEGVKLRLRRIALSDLAAGQTVDGETLLLADMRYQIDNMEAVDSWIDATGRTRIALLSDDNNSFLQRNLYLEFRLAEPGSAGRSMEKTTP